MTDSISLGMAVIFSKQMPDLLYFLEIR